MIRKKQGKIKNASKAEWYRRKLTIRKKVAGTAERPRVCITRSDKNLFVQVIDDETSKTLFSVQTFGKNAVTKGSGKEAAKVVGAKVAEGLKEKNIKEAVFDRAGYNYSLATSLLADSIRENGIQL